MIVNARRRLAARRPGFTLLEVLVVVAILVILAGVAGVYVFGFLDESKVNVAIDQCGKIERAAEAFMIKPQAQGITPTLQLLVAPDPSMGIPPVLDGGPAAVNDPWGKPYNLEILTDSYGKPAARCTTTEGMVAGQGTPIMSKKWRSMQQ